MTQDTDLDRTAQGSPLLRLVTLAVGSIAIILLVLRLHLMLLAVAPFEMTSAGDGPATLLLVALMLLAVPGLLLAWLDRAPRTALTLVLLALPLGIAL